MHATILKGIVGGFEFSVFQRNLKELARKAMEMCLRVLKESNKSSFDSYSRQEQCVDHIPYYLSGLSRAHFSDNLSRNSCILNKCIWHSLVGEFSISVVLPIHKLVKLQIKALQNLWPINFPILHKMSTTWKAKSNLVFSSAWSYVRYQVENEKRNWQVFVPTGASSRC